VAASLSDSGASKRNGQGQEGCGLCKVPAGALWSSSGDPLELESVGRCWKNDVPGAESRLLYLPGPLDNPVEPPWKTRGAPVTTRGSPVECPWSARGVPVEPPQPMSFKAQSHWAYGCAHVITGAHGMQNSTFFPPVEPPRRI
jgi:hypothetical protein